MRRVRRIPLQRKVEICTRAYRILLVEQVGFPPSEDVIFDPECVRGGHRYRGAQPTMVSRSSRPDPGDYPQACPGMHKISGGISNVSFSFRGNNVGARGDPCGFSLPCDRRPDSRHGYSQRGPARQVYNELSGRRCASGSRMSFFNRRADATERLLEVAETIPGRGRRIREIDQRGSGLAQLADVEKRLEHALVKRYRRVSSRRIPRRRGAATSGQQYRGDRRPADGAA